MEELLQRIEGLQTPQPKTASHVHGSRTVTPDFILSMISAVEQLPEVRAIGTFDPDEGHAMMQFTDAFRPFADRMAGLLASVRYTMEARKASVAAAALSTYAVMKGLARTKQGASGRVREDPQARPRPDERSGRAEAGAWGGGGGRRVDQPARPPARRTLYHPPVVVLFRLLLHAFVLSRFRRRIDLLDTAVITMRVWPNDLDLNMHMNSGRYLSMNDIGRIEMLARARVFREAWRRRWRPMAGGVMIRYRRSLLLFQRFSVRSRILCWDEKWFYFEHIIERRGELITLAYTRTLLRGPEANVPPDEVLGLLGKRGFPSPPMPPVIARWNEAESLA